MNFQNVPRGDKVVKAAFVPKLDALLFFDYSNIELRMLAYYVALLGDDSIAEEFKAGKDLHRISAQGVFGREDVTDEQRQVGKVLNFSIVYGGGCPTLIEQGIAKDYPEALRILRAYHAARPGISNLQRQIKKRLDQRGYITTLWGRHLHPRSEHAALNALLQGGAADLIKQAMRRVNRWYAARPELQSHLVNCVHDELQFDTPLNEIPLLRVKVPELMDEPRISKIVPVTTECEWSTTTWADKQPFEKETIAA